MAAKDSPAVSRALRLDRLLGRVVHTRDNRAIGRLEEFRAERHGRDWFIVEYHIGPVALLERLGLGARHIVGVPGSGLAATWEQLDLSDPDHPRLTCPLEQLRRL